MTQVLILAAGKSTRTWPIEEKIFFEIRGKTLLEWQIETLQEADFKDICIVGNSENIQKIKEICGKKEGRFFFSTQEDLETGIRGGILAAQQNIHEEKPLLVVCSNDIVEKSAFELIQKEEKKSNSDIFLVGKKVEKYFPGGYLQINCEKNVDKKKYIQKIVEKPEKGTEPSNLVTLLIHFFRSPKILLSALKKQKEGDRYEEILQSLFDSGIHAEALEYNGFWQAIKYPWHFLEVSRFFLEKISETRIHPDAHIAKTALIGERVEIAQGAKVFDGAIIAGPAYIGKKTIIANHVLVRESVVENNCVIGHSTEIARSILQNSCWTHQNFVGDSVFGENVSLGAGTKTANLRLEEGDIFSQIKGQKISSDRQKLGSIIGKNARIGVNTSLMPGIKIGSESFIGAGVVIGQDIPEKKFICGKTEIKEKENHFFSSKRRSF